MKLTLGLVVVLVMLTTAAWGQTQDRPGPDAFRVTWKSRPSGTPMIEGAVYNTSAYRVTAVRLRVEGFNDASNAVGEIFAWAIGDIPPSGQTSFVAESVPGAVTYRITVVSYDVVARP